MSDISAGFLCIVLLADGVLLLVSYAAAEFTRHGHVCHAQLGILPSPAPLLVANSTCGLSKQAKMLPDSAGILDFYTTYMLLSVAYACSCCITNRQGRAT